MLAIRLWWLGMDILLGDKVFCSLHPQGQSDSAGQHGWLFSAIVIYSSTQPEPVETHYPYCHVLFCSPLGTCTHTHFGQWQTYKKAYLPTTNSRACMYKMKIAHNYIHMQSTCSHICAKKSHHSLATISIGAHLWREWCVFFILMCYPIMDVGFFLMDCIFCLGFWLMVSQKENVNSNDVSWSSALRLNAVKAHFQWCLAKVTNQ